MAITLEGIALPSDIQWTDEYQSFGVTQTVTPTLTGALVVEESVQQAGRKITLASNGGAWVYQPTLDALLALAALPLDGTTLTLNWNGTLYSCVFDHGSTAVEAEEVLRLADHAQTDQHPYFVTIRLITS